MFQPRQSLTRAHENSNTAAQPHKLNPQLGPRLGPYSGPRLFGRRAVFAGAAGLALLASAAATPLAAEDAGPLLSPGDGVVTGFSGIAPRANAKGSPLDTFFIDLNGASAQIISLLALPGAANGAVDLMPGKRRITAQEVGQVFAIALDDGTDGANPSAYLGATSAFGINLVKGDENSPERLRKGDAEARFMPGQFGPNGSPGSIWKVDGETGVISEFASLPNNSGPGVGDIVFDKSNEQFFASDLDSGLIYRIGADGSIIDSFDHGTAGRPTEELAALEDDGKTMDIKAADFDTEDPSTWGFTAAERMVSGLAVNDGRLYYATAGIPRVWSVSISDTGEFGDDARLEIDVEGLVGDGPITDMLFDKNGMLYLAQRGPGKGAYNYAEFAEPAQSNVVRYKPSQSSGELWEAVPESYAIGVPPEHNAGNGGIALGYKHDDTGIAQLNQCGGTLWSTGGRLTTEIAQGDSGDNGADVHGLQGNAIDAVRPANTPPEKSYFLDYDGLLGDPEKAGHIGDIEIFQICDASAKPYVPTKYPPGYYEPPSAPPPGVPPYYPPPEIPFTTNLRLDKSPAPETCSEWLGGWACYYDVTVTNTGPENYFGDIQIRDWVPAVPPGGFFGVGPVPPWACWLDAPNSMSCWRPNVFLVPGQSVSIDVLVWFPGGNNICTLRNRAEISWAPGGTQWNNNPTDDEDDAMSFIPDEGCDECPPGFEMNDGICEAAVIPLQQRVTPVHRPIGSKVHRPVGSNVHRPRGSNVHRPIGSKIHRPRGSNVHRPIGSVVHRPRGSDVHRPIGSNVHRPIGSEIHLPIGSKVHRTRPSRIHKRRGSDIHKPIGSEIHLPIGSKVHRTRPSRIHKRRGSDIHRPRGSKIHLPIGSKVHRPKGSKVHRPRGSKIHLPIGSKVHRPKGSRVHRPYGSKVHRPQGSKIHYPKGSKIKIPGGPKLHFPKGSKVGGGRPNKPGFGDIKRNGGKFPF